MVDDDYEDVLIMEELLEDELSEINIELEHAENYDLALEKLLSGNYNLAFFDYHIGSETGLDLFKKVRAQGIDVPIVFASGQGNEKIANTTKQLGALGYLVKSDYGAEEIKKILAAITNTDSNDQGTPEKSIFVNPNNKAKTVEMFMYFDQLAKTSAKQL